jgi:hypothetical protein
MSVTPLILAQFSDNIYTSLNEFDRYWETDDVVVGLKRVDDTDVLVLRGSVTTEDWVRDASAVPKWHRQLGFCHAGFLAGMDDVFAEVRTVVGPKKAISGHSLGGARARILAAMFAYNQLPVDQLCVFGSPKPAFTNVARIIAKSGMAHTSYRNRNDIVPTLPLTVGSFDFVHTEPWIAVDAAPAQTDLEALRDHSSSLYVVAQAALAARRDLTEGAR